MVVRIVLGVVLILHGAGHIARLLTAYFPQSQSEPISDRVLGRCADTGSAAAGIIGVPATGGFGHATRRTPSSRGPAHRAWALTGRFCGLS